MSREEQRATKFEVFIENPELLKAMEPANDAARKAFERGERGMIVCQALRTADGKIRIRGYFIENERASKIIELTKP